MNLITSTKGKVIAYTSLGLFACFFLLPGYVLIATSFKSFQSVSIAKMWQLPANFSLIGFVEAIKKLAPHLLNSFILTIPATFFSAMLGSINGYILSQWKFKGSDTLFAVLLFGMFIPYQSILIPLVRFLQEINLYGSLTGLIFVHIVYGIPITTLMFRNYYAKVPHSLTEAAQVDGAGIIGIYKNVFFPISLPGFVVVVIWQFTNVWNEFLFAVTITNNPLQQPITVALVNLAGSRVVEWNVQMSGAIVAALPTLLIYIFFGRYFIEGLLSGSVKG